ncbi:conjugative transposon protein TraN [Sphingobacterium mizutaii]|uniref:conjugative transposon protein TraN n=1 Tax=Sphingobacterium mizutaii TaxID=1010 RepID=UPI001628AAC2|nr:conjugative transposon protein TraN [Sphingobacterium mizutaii]
MDKLPHCIILSVFLLAFAAFANGQYAPMPQRIRVSENMTTNLIFSMPILSVDLGSFDILAQKASGVQNVLQVKAASKELIQTNLTVITQDGKLHSFLASYAEFADPINLIVGENLPEGTYVPSIPNRTKVPPIQVGQGMDWVRNTDLVPVRLMKKSDGISFSLDGIFIQGKRMYLRFRFYNESHIPFKVDQFRLFLKDNRTAKRTAAQEIEIIPEYVDGQQDKLHEHVPYTWIVSLPSFTIPEGKHLWVELIELSGGRDLGLKVRNRHVLKTLPVPFIQ